MHIDFMHIVDYWVGIPLCFLISLWDRFWRLLLGFKNPAPKRILFIELSEMGSAIIAYPSIHKAKQLFTPEAMFFLIFAKNRESVSILNSFPEKNILTIRDDSFFWFLVTTLKAVVRLRREGVDTAFNLELFSRCTELLTYLCGASNRVSFDNYTAEGLYKGSFMTHRVFYNPHQHMALNFLSLVLALEADKNELPLLKRNVCQEFVELPKHVPSKVDLDAVKKLLASEAPKVTENQLLVILNPDPGEIMPVRGWPLRYYCELAGKIAQDPNTAIVVVGLESASPYAHAIGQMVPKQQFVNLAGKTKSLSELTTLFAMAKVLVTNDSGPAHVAALTAIEKIVLFGPETPDLYAPLGGHLHKFYANLACSPCLSAANHRNTVCTNNLCLKLIEVDQVYRLVHELLQRASS